MVTTQDRRNKAGSALLTYTSTCMSLHGHVSKKTTSLVLRPWKTVITSPGACWMVLFTSILYVFSFESFSFCSNTFCMDTSSGARFPEIIRNRRSKKSSRTGGISKGASLLRVENFRIFWSLWHSIFMKCLLKVQMQFTGSSIDCHFVWRVPLDPSVSYKKEFLGIPNLRHRDTHICH